MNKKELKQLLAIARPAIIAAYGRGQDHHVTGYFKISDSSIWLEVQRFSKKDFDWVTYKLKIEAGKVTYLNKGELTK